MLYVLVCWHLSLEIDQEWADEFSIHYPPTPPINRFQSDALIRSHTHTDIGGLFAYSGIEFADSTEQNWSKLLIYF